MKKRNGFTLIELLAVIAIIALLLAVLVPALGKARDYSRRVLCTGNVRQIGVAIRTYVHENDDRLIPMYHLGGSITAGTRYDADVKAPLPTGVTNIKPLPYNVVITHVEGLLSSGKPRPYHLGVLYAGGFFSEPEAFYCPAQPRITDYPFPYYYEAYTERGEWGSYVPTYGGNAFVRTSYNYWIYDKKKYNQLGLYPLVVDNLQEWEVIPHRKNRGVSSAPQGVSALFSDGHVNFCMGDDLFSGDTWNNKNRSGDGYSNGPGDDTATFEKILRVICRHP